MNFIKIYWKLILIGIAALLVAYGFSSHGWREYQTYKEAQAIRAGQEEIIADLEKAEETIGQERDALLKEKFALEEKRASLEGERKALNERICALENRLIAINIPVDPAGLTQFWQDRGFRPVLRSK